MDSGSFSSDPWWPPPRRVAEWGRCPILLRPNTTSTKRQSGPGRPVHTGEEGGWNRRQDQLFLLWKVGSAYRYQRHDGPHYCYVRDNKHVLCLSHFLHDQLSRGLREGEGKDTSHCWYRIQLAALVGRQGAAAVHSSRYFWSMQAYKCCSVCTQEKHLYILMAHNMYFIYLSKY
jgi:hypothetical protein